MLDKIFLLIKTFFVRIKKLITLIFKGIKSLIIYGPKGCYSRVNDYLKNRTLQKELHNKYGDEWQQYDADMKFNCEYQNNIDFSKNSTDIKPIAFYLPQFHTFAENDKWWGKGFTEWTNTKKGVPKFDGHYQPRTPHDDIGYYTLDDIDTIRNQANLAKQHGIYGFCFYYYWFSGKRLMEKPVDMLLKNPDIDLPFCLCWANENWTRAWDGQNKDIIMEQKYLSDDPERFIDDMIPYISDSRYIKIDGKPIIILYNPGALNNCGEIIDRWRERAKNIGIGDILIWTCQTANNNASILNIIDKVDAEVEFPPHNMWFPECGIRVSGLNGKSANIFSYRKLVHMIKEKISKELKNDTKVPLYRSVMMGWDNAARRKEMWTTFHDFSLPALYNWVIEVVNFTRHKFPENHRYMFVNAWNEWAEGTYLEPDEKYGYANINTVSKAIFDQPIENTPIPIQDNTDYGIWKQKSTPRIALHIHLYYLDTILEIKEKLQQIPYTFDLYISTDSNEKSISISSALVGIEFLNNINIEVFENRGRDVLPFLMQMKNHIHKYDYIGHIHSKKTATSDYGDGWRRYLYKHLFGHSDKSKEYLKKLFCYLDNNEDIGIVYPETYPVLLPQVEWGGNKERCKEILNRIGYNYKLSDEPVFPVGNMFWARTSAVKDIFNLNLNSSNFEQEAGQVNATLAHCIERIWVYAARKNGFRHQTLYNNISWRKQLSPKNRIAFFVHYDKNNIVSNDDLNNLKSIIPFVDNIYFISNSKLSEYELSKIKSYVTKYITRPNIGYDFSAWRDGLKDFGFDNLEKTDEVILFNNSGTPIYPLNIMFGEMEEKQYDFWGVSLFPYSSDGTYLKKDHIDEHIQSYFMVFSQKVIKSQIFKQFWLNLPDYENFIDLISNTESILTNILKQAGYSYGVHLEETKLLSSYLNNYSIPYSNPYSYLMLGSPFLKKKREEYQSLEEKIRINNFIDKIVN